MLPLPVTTGLALSHYWSQTVLDLFRCQWNLFEYQYQAYRRMMEMTLPCTSGHARPEELAGETADELERLTNLAEERVRQGLAPPKEIYEVWYRDRIDWSRFPGWAWPCDPDLFEGCGHEG